MQHQILQKDNYQTIPGKEKLLHRLLFRSRIYYVTRFLLVVFHFWPKARANRLSREDWYNSSLAMFNFIEDCGGIFNIRGLENLNPAETPVVIIGNHMSTLETVILPFLVLPFKYAIFVIKEQIFKIPFFGPYTKSTGCIGVSRKSPSEDFKQVIKEGSTKLQNGQSVIVFPQSTRDTIFNPENFNSLGIKLAKRNKVPVIPLAVKTDFWTNGKIFKDFGPLNLSKKIHFEFGEPFEIKGSGKEEHQRVVEFIKGRLKKWNSEGTEV
jgi:1-acyl-sn-glycerol-3-phosphate acyltransferase